MIKRNYLLFNKQDGSYICTFQIFAEKTMHSTHNYDVEIVHSAHKQLTVGLNAYILITERNHHLNGHKVIISTRIKRSDPIEILRHGSYEAGVIQTNLDEFTFDEKVNCGKMVVDCDDFTLATLDEFGKHMDIFNYY